MPIMTRSGRHIETTIPMIDPNTSLNDQRCFASSREVAAKEPEVHRDDSGA